MIRRPTFFGGGGGTTSFENLLGLCFMFVSTLLCAARPKRKRRIPVGPTVGKKKGGEREYPIDQIGVEYRKEEKREKKKETSDFLTNRDDKEELKEEGREAKG